MFFEKNRHFLTKHFPFLINELTGPLNEEITLEVERSKTGLPVARVNRAGRKVYLNSPYDPELDAQRWVENQIIQAEDTNPGNILLCGGGFLYHVKELLNRDIFQKIVVYEPSPIIFRACLQEVDLGPFCRSSVLLLTGANIENISKQILAFFGKDFFTTETGFRLTILPSYKDIFQEELDLFQNKLTELVKIEHINFATTNKYIETWIENQYHNLQTITDTPVLRHFLGRFQNVPAIIVSAGPSLEKNISLLNDVKEKALIICAGSSIRAMKRNGVSPHFLLAVDPHEINTKVYNDLDLSDIYFLYTLSFYHGVVSHLSGRKIIFRNNSENFSNYLVQTLDYEFGMLNCGLSCANTCLDLAYLLGCRPIILIGQDLAYTGNKRYAEGQIAKNQKYLKANELPKGLFITKDIYGQDVVTDKQLDSFRVVFETMISKLFQGKTYIINATEGGQPIKGTENRKLAEVIAEYCREDRGMSNLIRHLYESGLKELRNRRIDPKALVITLKKLMDQGIDKMDELIDQVQQLRKSNYYGETDFQRLDVVLEKLATEYDLALNIKEYHWLLKELQVTRLSISKFRTVETAVIKCKDEYDARLRNYLLIILETKNALEFIRKNIVENFQIEEAGRIEFKGIMKETDEYKILLKKICLNDNPDELCRLLEAKMKHIHNPDERCLYLYLFGLLQARQGRKDKAIIILEEAVKLIDSFAEAQFLLAKLYYEQRKFTRAVKSLTKCREYGFKPQYCLKMLLKVNYFGKDYIALKNLIEEYPAVKTSRRLLDIIRIECLARMGLIMEAVNIYRNLAGQYRLSQRLTNWVDNLINTQDENKYAANYRTNLEFFRKRGISFEEFATVRYKSCRFLGGEIIYDSASGKFLLGIEQKQANDLKVWLEDVLAIHDNDNIGVFEHLQMIEKGINSSDIQAQFRNIPIYVIDHNREHWHLLMQLYDFTRFDDWHNMRFFIGVIDEELQRVFVDEELPFPNIIYGTEYKHFENLLKETKQEKDEVYLRNIQELKEYYHDGKEQCINKILLVFNFQIEASRFYANTFKNYLEHNGVECRMYYEDPPYIRITPYITARLLNEYRPDLIFGLGFVQEEIQVINEIPVPFVGWLMAEKSLEGVSRFDNPGQRLLITGNLKVQNEMESKGLPDSRIQEIFVPIVPAKNDTLTDVNTKDIGIITDLIDLEETFKNMEVVIFAVLSASFSHLSGVDVAAILKTIYFKIHTEYIEKGLIQIENELYERITEENFSKYGFVINQDTVRFISALLKRELENYLFKIMQAKWVIDNYRDYHISFNGTGWGKIEKFKSYHPKTLGFFTDPVGYQQLVLQNKINLYIGNILHNNSYWQPDLLYGIAAGGFFLVNDLLVKKYGTEILGPFGGLLETYSNQEELKQKVEFYLSQDQERMRKANLLKKYILQNFGMEQFKEKLFQTIKLS